MCSCGVGTESVGFSASRRVASCCCDACAAAHCLLLRDRHAMRRYRYYSSTVLVWYRYYSAVHRTIPVECIRIPVPYFRRYVLAAAWVMLHLVRCECGVGMAFPVLALPGTRTAVHLTIDYCIYCGGSLIVGSSTPSDNRRRSCWQGSGVPGSTPGVVRRR